VRDVDGGALEHRAALEDARVRAAAAGGVEGVAAEARFAVLGLERVADAMLQVGDPRADGADVRRAQSARWPFLGGRR
jgi:hypothetical protein